jgi:prepilin-type N-terminal cleavage/methylation domain-containing protein
MRMSKQDGLSLVELMVAMALAVLLMAGVLSIFQSTKVTYLTNEKTARLQENGRLALELMMYDLRAAGYGGCARATTFTTTLNPGIRIAGRRGLCAGAPARARAGADRRERRAGGADA